MPRRSAERFGVLDEPANEVGDVTTDGRPEANRVQQVVTSDSADLTLLGDALNVELRLQVI